MRIIENREFIINKELNHVIDYFEVIVDILKTPPTEGWTKDTLQRIAQRIETIEKFKGKLPAKIEENEYQEIINGLDIRKWGITVMAVIEFDSYLRNLSKEKVS